VDNDSFSGNLSDRHLTSQLKLGAITQHALKASQSYIADDNYIIMTYICKIFKPVKRLFSKV